jgi:hypothetical protein
VRWLVLSLFVFASCSGVHESKANAASDNGASVTLRFRPKPGARWREHWTHDIDAPGTGVVRTGLSLDMTVAPLDAGSFSVRATVRKQYRARDGEAESTVWLGGTTFSSTWGADRAWVGELGVEARTPEAAKTVREIVNAARFGMLIEYPDQAVGIGDSWSIEPRSLQVGPGLEAILRPSYTLQQISKAGEEREVTIGADVQVDLISQVLGDGVVVEGGGTASGTLRVRERDGLLLESRSVLHFSQEVRVQGTQALGYREFSATARMVATGMNVNADLARDPRKPEPGDAEEERACALQLTAASARVGKAPQPLPQFVAGAIELDALPVASAGAPAREPGAALLVHAEDKLLELDGAVVEPKDLARALRGARATAPVYVYAPATSPLERLRAALAALPPATNARLMVRAQSDESPPKPSRWLEDQLRRALVAPAPERRARMNQLLVEHLVLCDGALDAFRKTESSHTGASELPARIERAFEKCGCTTTNVESLETTLRAMYGSPMVHALRVPLRLERRLHGASGVATVQDVARALARAP